MLGRRKKEANTHFCQRKANAYFKMPNIALNVDSQIEVQKRDIATYALITLWYAKRLGEKLTGEFPKSSEMPARFETLWKWNLAYLSYVVYGRYFRLFFFTADYMGNMLRCTQSCEGAEKTGWRTGDAMQAGTVKAQEEVEERKKKMKQASKQASKERKEKCMWKKMLRYPIPILSLQSLPLDGNTWLTTRSKRGQNFDIWLEKCEWKWNGLF